MGRIWMKNYLGLMRTLARAHDRFSLLREFLCQGTNAIPAPFASGEALSSFLSSSLSLFLFLSLRFLFLFIRLSDCPNSFHN